MQIDMKRVDPEANMDRFYSIGLTKDLFGDLASDKRLQPLKSGLEDQCDNIFYGKSGILGIWFSQFPWWIP